MGKLAFFPWLELKESLECGEFRLLQYRRREAPAADSEEQAAIDDVLRPYQTANGDPVTRATILQHASQGTPTDPVEEGYHVDLFVFSEILAFAGLASRRFFSNFEYSNRDHYRLILQQFTDPGRGVLITTRRRDGSTNSFFTGDVYTVQRPNHLGHGPLTLEAGLLEALLQAMATDTWPELYQSLILFGEANTDRIDMPVGTEVLLAYAAFEQALGLADARARDVTAEFADLLEPDRQLPSTDWTIPEDNPRAAQLLEKAPNIRTAWLQDLANSRGSLAHGHSTEAYPACWAPHEHLLLAAHALPLVVKKRLAAIAGYDLTSRDRAGIEALEPLINTRHFEVGEDGESVEKHPWPDIISEHQMRAWVHDAADKYESGEKTAS